MSDIAKKITRLGQLRTAALVAVVIPAALLAGCAQQPAPPPPAPAPVAAPSYVPPPAPAAPVVRG